MTSDVVSLGLLAVAVVSFAVSAVSGLAMLGHLQGGNRELLRVVMLGPFAPPNFFTAAGWRHRTRSLWAGLIAFASFAIWAFLKFYNR
jgi:hypothetical protein